MTLQITGDAKEIAELIEMLQKQFTKDAKLRNYVCGCIDNSGSIKLSRQNLG